MITCQIVLQ